MLATYPRKNEPGAKDRQCPVCKIHPGEEEDIEHHKNTEIHRFNWALDEFNRKRKTICKDREHVVVDIQVKPKNGFRDYRFSTPFDKEGCYTLTMTPEEMQNHSNKIEFLCNIKNTSQEKSVILTYARLLHPYGIFSLSDPKKNLDNGKFIELSAGADYQIIVQFQLKQTTVSRFKIPLYLTFQPKELSKDGFVKDFSIVRSIIVGIHYDYEIEEDSGKSPFTNLAWEISREDLSIVRPNKTSTPFTDKYPIPRQYRFTLKMGLKETKDNFEVLQEIRNMIDPGRVTGNNYVGFFSIMLWLEETACIIGLSSYNMENVTLLYRRPYLILEVPGLAEKRPSVIVGDKIEIRIHDDHTIYQGFIKNVTDSTVEIGEVHDDCVEFIQNNPRIEMDVRFILGRVNFERMHQGIRTVEANGFIPNLFPNETCANMRISEPFQLTESQFLNKDIYNNNEQRTAVQKILNNSSKNVPYIVYGPPGTGKTMTIVEAIIQIKTLTKKKILVCAPANAACNMLMQRLAQYCKYNELKRVVSATAEVTSISNEYLKYTNIDVDEDGYVITPVPVSELNKYRIVITTLILAGKYTGQYRPDVVFIDEAAQAREPEACCAIGLLGPDKQLVLAGDPKQLGPSVDSAICQKYKYGVSILERLWNLPLYQLDEKNNFITMLKLNFRSHPGILEIPNHLFYEDNLQAMSIAARNDPVAKVFTYTLLKKKSVAKLETKDCSLEFCSILSQEKREGRSPSYFNPKEIQMVVKYVEALTSLSESVHPRFPVQPSEIGVVTPYIRQVYKVREALFKLGFDAVEVGTTEAFQGREKRVMIITTVRAQEDLLLFDKRYKLGFVSNEKRFNVAITRAMSKLIVIGNPLVLLTDQNWTKLIETTFKKGSFGGADYKNLKRTKEVRMDIENRFSQLKLPETKNKNKNKKKGNSQKG